MEVIVAIGFLLLIGVFWKILKVLIRILGLLEVICKKYNEKDLTEMTEKYKNAF